ncbi:uncharacterized protein LOC130669321 [Microplitis mediator]|uniref:uncharacterized protein LOC130669321 n=1 Tax=Microplitis mediator TaxID=375433 RepID=UPI0025547443|nr:uncharacterized protein LOC130669321 [Microplitis mediator]
MWTRVQETCLVQARLVQYEHLFQSISFEYVNLWDENAWEELAEETNLINSKTPFECFKHFCQLFHEFKYHKGVSKRG